MVVPALLLLAAVLLPSVAGGHGGAARSACAHAGRPIPRPGGFPHGLPLPTATVLDSSRRLPGGYVVLGGYTAGSLAGVKRFIRRQFPRAGYRLGGADSEAREADTDFHGHGVVGRVTLRTVYGCHAELSIAIAYKRPTL